MNFFAEHSNAFGLDISDLSLKIIKLEKSGDVLKLVSFGETAVPPGIIEDSKVVDERALGAVIKKALSQVKGRRIKNRYVISSLPEEKSFLDVFQLPPVEKHELESAVRFEAENHIPIGIDDVYFDFEIVPRFNSLKAKQQEVLIAAVPRDIADSYLAAVKLAGLYPLAMEIECLAVARAVVENNIAQNPLLIIDFGKNRTSFIIFWGQTIRFTSTIPVSSKTITKNIAQKLKISMEKAEKLKTGKGLKGEKELVNAMAPLLTDLTNEIKNHLSYYKSHAIKSHLVNASSSLHKILLCGGGANLKGLPEFLSAGLNTEVELANPWVNIFKKPLKEVPLLPFKESLGYATALGLALKAVNKL